ncbi:MAG: AAA family ATPase [Dehalococcoidia bacterium]
MIPAKLSLTNFMCYRHDTPPLTLEGIQVACICGDNGHGKSALLDAITWVLWGKARAKSVDDLIHLGQSDMEVELEFTARDNRYRVIRKHSRGRWGRAGQTLLELHVASGPDGSSFRPTTANTVRETQRRIIDLLRMDYDTFVNSAFLRQGRADEFTLRTPKERKEVLAEILGLSMYDKLEDRARKRARDLEIEIAGLERDIAGIDQELGRRRDYEAEEAQALARVTEVEKQEASQRTTVQELGRRVDVLEVKKEEIGRLERRLQQVQQDLKQVQREAEEYRAKQEDFEKALADRASVKEGYILYREALDEKEELDRRLARAKVLIERRGRLEKDLEAERGKLTIRREGINARAQNLQEKIEGLDVWEEELADASVKLANLEELEAEVNQQREKVREISARGNHLKTVNDQLVQEMTELKGKLEMLTEGEAQCPLCGTALGQDGLDHIRKAYQQQGQDKKRSYLENERTIKDLLAEQDSSQRELQARESELGADKKKMQGRISVLERDIEEAKKASQESASVLRELADLDEQLSSGKFAAELQQELAPVTSELDSLSYDQEAHQEVQKRSEELRHYEELYRRLQEAEARLPEVQQSLERAKAREARLQQEFTEESRRRDAIASELTELPRLAQELEVAKEAHSQLLEEQRRWRDRLAALQETLKRLAEMEQSRKTKKTTLKETGKRKGIFEELGHAFGKGGVQALIIETALPEIEEEANRLLGRMTDNRMHVKIETQREKKTGGAQETLDINISDELGTRPYELYSGGEAFRINFALRIALSKLLAHRAGAPLPILFIDEGFGTQDGTGREKLLETINSIQSDFERIIVITHIEDLKDAFPIRIQVTKNEEGSTFSIN